MAVKENFMTKETLNIMKKPRTVMRSKLTLSLVTTLDAI